MQTTRMNERELERTLKALANKRRLGILRFLKNRKEANVGDIAEAIRLSFKSTSRHLAVLFSANLLDKEQRSLEVHYRLASGIERPIVGLINTL